MKKYRSLIAAVLMLVMVLAIAGCGKKSNSLVGTWEYKDEATGLGAVYVLKDDGTGTYTMTVGDQTVEYKLKYEVQDNHLLVRYVENETFSEDDVFDNEFNLKDSKTLIVKDSFGTEMTFVKK